MEKQISSEQQKQILQWMINFISAIPTIFSFVCIIGGALGGWGTASFFFSIFVTIGCIVIQEYTISKGTHPSIPTLLLLVLFLGNILVYLLEKIFHLGIVSFHVFVLSVGVWSILPSILLLCRFIKASEDLMKKLEG